ncbi:MAG: hypothetical protein IJW43_03075 [Clostridia bacterium]|nr:hypothetical protein [Clostridia bacterium]
MTNKKTVRGALVVSIIALITCISMLFGTTAAWFTDSVSNTNNIIKSGNVDVELWHTHGSDSEYGFGYVENVGTEVDGTTKLFANADGEQILWEPGASVMETFRIENVGSLALKYEFRIKPIARTYTEDGKALTDIIKLQAIELGYFDNGVPYLVDGGLNEQVVFGDGYVIKGSLLANEKVDYNISLDWEASANDNDYNVKDGLSLILGIELVATQYSSEVDGFGKGFDDSAEYPSVSNEVAIPANRDEVTSDITLETEGEKAVKVEIPSNLAKALPADVESVSLVHSEPVIDQANNTVTINAIELVDQDGNIIDLKALATGEMIKVTLPKQEVIAEGMPVVIKHDGEIAAYTEVKDGGIIKYEVEHLCEVVVSLRTASVKDSAELATAIADGETIINLAAGTYKMTSVAQGKTLTLIGAGTDNTIIEVVPAGQGEAGGQLDYSFDGSNVTFNNLTIKTNSQLYAGFARLSGTYNNCVIQNTYNLGTGNSVFNNCTFNITNEYLRVGGAYSAQFIGCTFNTDGRAILVYQDGTSVAQTVLVKDCTFNATAAAETWNGLHVSAVSIDGTNGTYSVTLEGNNVVDDDFNGLWQIKAGEANVTVIEK